MEYIRACSRSIIPSAFLMGMVLGLDVSIFIVQLIKSPRFHDDCLAVSDEGIVGAAPSVVAQFQRMLQKLLSFGCTPLLVFDGALRFAPKTEERARREEVRLAAVNKLRAGGPLSPEETRRLQQISFKPGRLLMLAVAKMAFELSVPFIFAPMQADPQLAYLYSIGVVQCIASRDSDVAVFAGCILRDLNVFADSGVLYVENSADASSNPFSALCRGEPFWRRTHLRIALAVLGGCDYYRIPGVGRARALTVLQGAVAHVGGVSVATLDNVLAASVEVLTTMGFLPGGGTRGAGSKLLAALRTSAYSYCLEPVFDPAGRIRCPFPAAILAPASGAASLSEGLSQGAPPPAPTLPALHRSSRVWTLPQLPQDVLPSLKFDSLALWDKERGGWVNSDITGNIVLSLGGVDGAVSFADQRIGGVVGGLLARPGDGHAPRGAHLVPVHVLNASWSHLVAGGFEPVCFYENVVSLENRLDALNAPVLAQFLVARAAPYVSGSKLQLVNAVSAIMRLEWSSGLPLPRIDDPQQRERTLLVRDPDAFKCPSGRNVVDLPDEANDFSEVLYTEYVGGGDGGAGPHYARVSFSAHNKLFLAKFPYLTEPIIFQYYVGKEGMKGHVSAVNRARLTTSTTMETLKWYRPRDSADHCVTFLAPATIEHASRLVTVFFKVATGEESPFISCITRTACACAQGSTGLCVHVALVLRLLLLLPLSHVRTATSGTCLWNAPSAQSVRQLECGPRGLPAASYPRLGMHLAGGAGGGEDSVQHYTHRGLLSLGGRGAVVPLPPRAAGAPIDSPEYMRTRAALWEEAARHIPVPPHPSPLHDNPPRCLDELHYGLHERQRKKLFMSKKEQTAFDKECDEADAAAALGTLAAGGAAAAAAPAASPEIVNLGADDLEELWGGTMGGVDADGINSDVDGDLPDPGPDLSAVATDMQAARMAGAQARMHRHTKGGSRKKARVSEAAAPPAAGAGGDDEAIAVPASAADIEGSRRPWAAHHPRVSIPNPGALVSDGRYVGRYLCFYCGPKWKKKHFGKDAENPLCKHRAAWQALMLQRQWRECTGGENFREVNPHERIPRAK
jgi:hypothetical protein